MGCEKTLKRIRGKFGVKAFNGIIVKTPRKKFGIICGADGDLLKIFIEETKKTEFVDPKTLEYEPKDYAKLTIRK